MLKINRSRGEIIHALYSFLYRDILAIVIPKEYMQKP